MTDDNRAQEAGALQAALDEVISRGGPAQSARARALLDRLAANGPTAGLREEIALLHDAHLNDPYLTRVEPGAAE